MSLIDYNFNTKFGQLCRDINAKINENIDDNHRFNIIWVLIGSKVYSEDISKRHEYPLIVEKLLQKSESYMVYLRGPSEQVRLNQFMIRIDPGYENGEPQYPNSNNINYNNGNKLYSYHMIDHINNQKYSHIISGLSTIQSLYSTISENEIQNRVLIGIMDFTSSVRPSLTDEKDIWVSPSDCFGNVASPLYHPVIKYKNHSINWKYLIENPSEIGEELMLKYSNDVSDSLVQYLKWSLITRDMESLITIYKRISVEDRIVNFGDKIPVYSHDSILKHQSVEHLMMRVNYNFYEYNIKLILSRWEKLPYFNELKDYIRFCLNYILELYCKIDYIPGFDANFMMNEDTTYKDYQTIFDRIK